jgi:hypothetical protein
MVQTSIWRKSRKFKQLDPLERLLYLYLITNEDTELCGAYELDLDEISLHTGIDSRMLKQMFSRLEEIGLAAYRDGWVLLLNYKAVFDNPKVRRGIEAGRKRLPEWVARELDGSDTHIKEEATESESTIAYDSLSECRPDNDNDNDNDNEQEKPPQGGGAVAPLSTLKDSLANHYQQRFVDVQPPSTWGNVAKERGQLTTLAKKTRALRRDTAVFENDVTLANALLSQFMALRSRGSSEYWRNAPFTPSGLTSRWDQVVTALAAEHEDAEAWRTA